MLKATLQPGGQDCSTFPLEPKPFQTCKSSTPDTRLGSMFYNTATLLSSALPRNELFYLQHFLNSVKWSSVWKQDAGRDHSNGASHHCAESITLDKVQFMIKIHFPFQNWAHGLPLHICSIQQVTRPSLPVQEDEQSHWTTEVSPVHSGCQPFRVFHIAFHLWSFNRRCMDWAWEHLPQSYSFSPEFPFSIPVIKVLEWVVMWNQRTQGKQKCLSGKKYAFYTEYIGQRKLPCAELFHLLNFHPNFPGVFKTLLKATEKITINEKSQLGVQRDYK